MWLSTFVFALSCALQVSGFLAQNRTTFTASRNHYHDANAAKRLTMWGKVWCGEYNKASKSKKWNDEIADINKCCQLHDNCRAYIDDGYTRWGLVNTVRHRTVWCKCDKNFMKCLRKAESAQARAVGSLFFNVLRTPCFNRKKDALLREKQHKTSTVTNSFSPENTIEYDEKTGEYVKRQRVKTKAFFVEPPLFSLSPQQDESITKAEDELWDKIIYQHETSTENIRNTGPKGGKKTQRKTKKAVKKYRFKFG
ncbi:uncharacterized protein [Clytia hemisphaerica]|uniref:uncharacterized protein isoform X1 n=1 Tax=Clytia hemisphaerica TaxID=252671 RepID=UPI0034D47DB6